MINLEAISNSISKKWSSKVPNKYPTVKDQIEVHAYGVLACLQILIEVFILIFVSFIFGVLIPTLIITLTFSSFRILGGGGYHFESYWKCATVSLLQFIGVALIIKYIYPYFLRTNIIVLFILTVLIGIYVIVRYVPRDTENKRITESKEIHKFKRWTTIYLSIWSIIMIISLMLNINLLIISSCFGLLLEFFSISKLGYEVVYPHFNKYLSS